MSDPNYDAKLRIFGQIRMHPWIPEHKLFIDAQLAMMDVMEPERAAAIRKQYDDKMQTYLSEQITQKEAEKEEIMAQLEQAASHTLTGETPVPVEGAPTMEDLEKIVEAKAVETEKKPAKRGRKPKVSSPS